MKQEIEALKAKFRALSMGARVALLSLFAIVCIGGVGGSIELYRQHSITSAMGGLIDDTNRIHVQQHGGSTKFGANVDHSTTTIHGGHSLVTSGDTLGGFMSGADKTKLDGIATGAQVVSDANVRAASASFSADPSFNSHKITSLADGTAASDSAAFHQIADAILAGKSNAVDAVTSGNLTLSGTQTVDGVSLVAGNRCLAYGQTTTTQDGCYVVAAGAWARCSDFPTGTGAADRCFVSRSGTSNKGVWCATNASGSDVIGTADLSFVNVAGAGGGGGLTSPLSAPLDFGGNPATNAADPTTAQGLVTRAFLDSRSSVITAATTGALPAYTTSGGPGVGFTLTANANGALAAQDGITLATNDTLFLEHGASTTDNGIYTLTQGTGGTPWVLVRHTSFDTAAEIAGSVVRMKSGVQRGSGVYTYRAIATITMGTTPLFWVRTDAGAGFNEVVQYRDELAEVSTTANAFTANGITRFTAGTGAAIAITSVNTGVLIGELSCSSGASAATTMCGISDAWTAASTAPGGAWGFIYSTANVGFSYQARVTVPTLSNGTNTFAVNVGLMKQRNTSQKLPADGCQFSYDSTSVVSATNWLASCTNAGTGTPVDTGVVVNAGQYYREQVITDAGSASVRFYIDGPLVATVTTNLPNGTVLGGATGSFKNTGTGNTNMMNVDEVDRRLDFPQGRVP